MEGATMGSGNRFGSGVGGVVGPVVERDKLCGV